jgi:hypothetical protein
MSISNLTKDEFVARLQHYLSPSGPIQSTELLRGRQKQLDTIEEALASPGRNVFICGDRGVGKTSLAQTAASRHQASGKNPVMIACDANTSFFSIIHAIAQTIHANPLGGSNISTSKFKIDVRVLSYEKQTTNDDGGIPPVTDINSAVLLLKHLSDGQQGRTLVVVDEFDLMKKEEDKVNFANLLKQVGDQRVNIQFIFCGIGKSLDDLLGAHGSAHRYIQEIELKRLIFDPRYEIIDASAIALGINIGSRMRTRIAAISDGFPHYIHLVCEKLFWELFRDPKPCTDVSLDHYKEAIRSAIEAVQPELRKTYDKATLKDVDDYEEVLWAVANHSDLFQHNDAIYDSYLGIMKERGKDPVERTKFTAKLTSLKSSSFGRILVSKKRNWTEFRETVVRGYVRLRAEDQGVELAQDCTTSTKTNEVWMKKTSKPVPTGMYRGAFYRRKH